MSTPPNSDALGSSSLPPPPAAAPPSPAPSPATKAARPIPPRRMPLSRHARRFSLLIVRGDGTRVLRVNVPRRVPQAAVAGLVVFLTALGVVLADWVHVRRSLRDSASLYAEIEQQQAVIDDFNRRAAELRREVAGWREMHARIWEAFGPELKARKPASGVGGKAEPPDRREPATLQEEVDLLTATVTEQGESLRALDQLIARARKALAMLPSRWPVRGRVNSEFGRRQSPWGGGDQEFHAGIDIDADRGTPVRAPAAGRVYHAGAGADYGLMVIVDHDNGVRTLYGHLSKILVKQGDRVERGTVLALTGNTGRSSGPHLHYEVLVKGQPVNPRAYLWD